MNGSGSRATPRPAEAIATSQSHWPLCAAMVGVKPACAKCWRRLRVRAKSSFNNTSGSSASALKGKVVRFFWNVPGSARAQIG